MTTENWREERDRLVRLVKAIQTGEVTLLDQGPLRKLHAASPNNVAALKDRLAELNARLGEDNR